MKPEDFDSSQYAKRLHEAGLTQPVADIEAETMGEMGRYLATLSAEAEKRDIVAEAARKETDAKIDTAIAGLNARIDTATAGLNARIDTATAKIDKVAIELNAKIDKVAIELNAKIDKVATELDTKIFCLGAELRAQMSVNQGEMIRWVVTVGILQSALVTALLLKLVH